MLDDRAYECKSINPPSCLKPEAEERTGVPARARVAGTRSCAGGPPPRPGGGEGLACAVQCAPSHGKEKEGLLPLPSRGKEEGGARLCGVGGDEEEDGGHPGDDNGAAQLRLG